MGTNWLHFHSSAKVSAPEVMPLEGAVSARRVTHAVYFHTCVCVSARALVELGEACGFTVIRSDIAINYVSLLLLRHRDFGVWVLGRVGL